MQIYKNLNTKEAKKIAKTRYDFMKIFLRQFLKEWSS